MNHLRLTTRHSGLTPLISHDLTGASIKFQVKRRRSDRTALLEFNTANGGIVIADAVAGLISIGKQTIDLPAGVYYYDIEITLGSGDVITVQEGSWEIVADVTW